MDSRLFDNLLGKQQNYILPFLWLHGEDTALVKNELHRIYDCGIRSVCLESRTHEDFCRDKWWSDVKFIFEECKKLDMTVWILDDKHFPSGYANGVIADKHPELRPFGICEEHVDICGPASDCALMADSHLRAPDDEIVAIAAMRHIPSSELYNEVIDITDGLSDGLVYFTLPEGMWRIVFMIKTRRGARAPFCDYCDMLNPDTIDLYIDEVYEGHYKHLSEYFGDPLAGFFSDEPCFGNNTEKAFSTLIGIPGSQYPWHKRVYDRLFAAHGESTPAELVKLWFEFADRSDADIKEEYMNIITDEYRTNFCNKLAAWCHAHKVEYIGHIVEDNNAHYQTGASAGHFFRAQDGQDMAGADVVLHQIIPGLTECSSSGLVCYEHMNNNFFHYYLAKLASSLAHIDPKKHGRALCEVFGAYGWAEGTKIMKYLTDHMLVRGINRFVPHAFSPKLNDPDCPPNFYDSGRNPLYKYFKNLMAYMSRMCHILSDAKHVPTCAILYDAESNWRTRDNLPLEDVAKVLYDNLLDYDIVPIDYLSRVKYPLLIIPYTGNLSPRVNPDKLSMQTICVSENGKEIDGFKTVALEKLADYLKDCNLNDVSSDYDGIYLRYCHYMRDGADIYMFSNEDAANTISANVRLSALTGGSYAIYDAMTNTAYKSESADGSVHIDLAPYNSIIIICGDIDYDGLPELKEKRLIFEKELAPVFEISLRREQEKDYTPYKTTDTLFNITGRGAFTSFAGNIKYDTSIEISDIGNYILDLGYAGEAASLYVNDHLVGSRLAPRYRFDISEFVKPGKNLISVIVSTSSAYERRDEFSEYLKFEPCGLLGPVKLIKYEI